MLGAYLLSSGVYDKYYYAAQKARTLITQDYDVCQGGHHPHARLAAHGL